MSSAASFRFLLVLGALALLTSCAEIPTTPTAVAPPTPEPGYWHGDGVPGSPKIIVSISEQRAYFYKGKNLVGESTVSTGKPGFGTPPGYYTVFWKHADHVSSVFGNYVDDSGSVVKSNIDVRKDSKPPGSHYDGARMPFAMFFRGGYAMHQGYVPPYAASHGCIRLPQGMAEVFFNNAEPGTPVIVKQEAVRHVVTVPPQVPVLTTVAPPPPSVVRTTGPAPLRQGPVSTTVSAPPPGPVRSPAPVISRAPGTSPSRSPSPAPFHSPAPNLVRSTAPPPVRPGPVRSPVSALPPGPVRSPAPVNSRAPGTFPYRSPSPAPLRSPAPNLIRPPAPPVHPSPGPVRLTVLAPSPGPARSPAPVVSRTPAPVQPPGSVRTTVPPPPPGPIRSPAPASVRPTPAPAPSRTPRHVRSRTSRRVPAPSPTPSPAR